MRRILKRILVMALVAAVLVPVVPAQALYYNGSSSYESGKYYQNLTEVVLTGDPRVDIVNIAMSQLGYQEGGSQNQLSGEVYGGVNHTEFGRWYGMQDMWCAMFVSWCANTAGISENVIPHHSYTPNGLNWFIKRGRAWSREQLLAGEYTPQPGDVIYFRSSRNKNKTNHVGLVTSYANGVIQTIEGNVGSTDTASNGGMVTAKSYPLTNVYVVYVCSPDYAYGGTNVPQRPAPPADPEAVVRETMEDTAATIRQAMEQMKNALPKF